jgi:hypothetical protein
MKATNNKKNIWAWVRPSTYDPRHPIYQVSDLRQGTLPVSSHHHYPLGRVYQSDFHRCNKIPQKHLKGGRTYF